METIAPNVFVGAFTCHGLSLGLTHKRFGVLRCLSEDAGVPRFFYFHSMKDARSGNVKLAKRKQSGILLSIEPAGPLTVSIDIVTSTKPDYKGATKDKRLAIEATVESIEDKEKWLAAVHVVTGY